MLNTNKSNLCKSCNNHPEYRKRIFFSFQFERKILSLDFSFSLITFSIFILMIIFNFFFFLFQKIYNIIAVTEIQLSFDRPQ